MLAESLQLERIAEQVVRYTMRFLQADGAIVVLAAEDGSSLTVAGAEGSLIRSERPTARRPMTRHW